MSFCLRGKGEETKVRVIKLLVILTAVLFLGCIKPQRVNEVYLIPRGFSGQIAVVFNVRGGEREVLENGWRVYNIPEDGILITQAKFNDTWHTEEYFFVADGMRVAIPRTSYGDPKELEEKGLGEDDAFACCGGASKAGDEYTYSLLYVGTLKEFSAEPKDYSRGLEFHNRVRLKLEKVLGRRVSE